MFFVQTLMAVMVGGFGLAGWYLGSSPTSATSESNVRVGESTMPWHISDEEAESGKEIPKYQYHPHGDKSRPVKNAPSALNEVVIPNVTLPEVGSCLFFLPQFCGNAGIHSVSVD